MVDDDIPVIDCAVLLSELTVAKPLPDKLPEFVTVDL